MKRTLAILLLILISLFLAVALALTEHIEYNISIEKDGSALWQIIHVTDLNSSHYSWDEFEQKIHSVMNSASENSKREMSLDIASLEMNTEIRWEISSTTTTYSFRWQNFCEIQGDQIVIGDVFSENIFEDLYGDGELYITYPADYSASLTSPAPNEQNNSLKLLHWYRTQDFTTNPNIELSITTSNSGEKNPSITTFVIVGSATSGFVAIGLVIFERRRRRKAFTNEITQNRELQKIMDSKEQILQLLKDSGGRMKQSEICSKLRFSRAKTSIVLAEMEKNKQVRRDKKGKNKIVYIMNGKN